MGINFQGYGSEIHGQNNDDDPSIQNIPIGNNCDDEALANLINISCMRIKVCLQIQ